MSDNTYEPQGVDEPENAVAGTTKGFLVKPGDALEIYKLWFARLTKEGDWFYERVKIFLQVHTALALAFAAIFYFFLNRTSFDLISVIALIGSVTVALCIGFLCLHQALMNQNGRFWQRFFTIKLAQIEAAIFLDPSSGIGESIERADAFNSVKWKLESGSLDDNARLSVMRNSAGLAIPNRGRRDLMDIITNSTWIAMWIWFALAAFLVFYSLTVVAKKWAEFTI